MIGQSRAGQSVPRKPCPMGAAVPQDAYSVAFLAHDPLRLSAHEAARADSRSGADE